MRFSDKPVSDKPGVTVYCNTVHSPKYGHSIVNLSTKDMAYCPSIIPTMYFEPPKEENLSTKNKSAGFMLSPKCPLFGGFTVLYTYMQCMYVHTSCPNVRMYT